MPPKVSAIDLFRRARSEGILLAPGPVFTNTGRFRNALRFAFPLDITPKVEQAIRRVGAMAGE